jgi:hypothetical protein
MAYVNYRFIAKAKASPANQIQDLTLEIPGTSAATVEMALVALAEKAQREAVEGQNYPSADQYGSPYAWLGQHLQYLTLTQADDSLVSYLVSGVFLAWQDVEAASQSPIFDVVTRAELKHRLAQHQKSRGGKVELEDDLYLGLVATGFRGQCVTWQKGDLRIDNLRTLIESLDPAQATWLKTLTGLDEIEVHFFHL